MRNRGGGKRGTCPPWNLQIQVILPNFAPHPRLKFGSFYHFFSALPPLDSNPYATAELIQMSISLIAIARLIDIAIMYISMVMIVEFFSVAVEI